MTIPFGPPLHQLLRNISILAGESSSGSDRGIAHFFMATKNTIKGVGGKNKRKRTIWARVNSSSRRLSCDTLPSLCICRLTLAWIFSEISTKLQGMPTHLDWFSLTAAGLYLIRLVSQMSGVD